MRKNILVAFILNLCFAVFEAVGGAFTGSVAILSDALHDLGDALSIGIAFLLEKKSTKMPDDSHTYGYLRYSLLGSVITTVILLTGSVVVVTGAVERILNPTPINYNGMIIFAVFGVIVNLLGTVFTHSGHSLNERAVSLHLLEDVLGWVVVLVGAIVMRFTDITFIDPLMSIAVAIFIFITAFKNLLEVLDIFLEKKPKEIDTEKIRQALFEVAGIKDVHHLHIRSLDGNLNIATMHIVADGDFGEIKHKAKHKLEHLGIGHSVIELEDTDEECEEKQCNIKGGDNGHHNHHHH